MLPIRKANYGLYDAPHHLNSSLLQITPGIQSDAKWLTI
jgi:hypothetical protein